MRDLGELSAVEWLDSQGYKLWLPIGHSSDCDVIADDGERFLRVQVKTTTRFETSPMASAAVYERR